MMSNAAAVAVAVQRSRLIELINLGPNEVDHFGSVGYQTVASHLQPQ